MMKQVDRELDDEGFPADPETCPPIGLEPGEELVWTGRPGSTGRLVRRSIPKALFGLLFIALTMLWMLIVSTSGLGKPNPNRVVRPFEPGNVGIAAMAGLWMIPGGLYLLTWPLRLAWRLRRMNYALTDRRAIVVEPRLLGRTRVRSYRPGSLALMRCDEQPDGSGDLIFEERPTRVNVTESTGFLGIEAVRDVESLVRRTLAPGRRPRAGRPGDLYGDDVPPASKGREITGSRSYRLPGFSLALLAFLGLVFSMGTLALLCSILLAPVLVILRVIPMPAAPAVVAGVGGPLICAIGFFFLARMLITMPFAITVDEDERIIWFRNWFRSRGVPAADFISVTTGGWRDPNRAYAEIRHKGGKLTLFNQYRDFRDFLERLKALNPSVDIRGF